MIRFFATWNPALWAGAAGLSQAAIFSGSPPFMWGGAFSLILVCWAAVTVTITGAWRQL
jgi:hypothetical protein